MNTPPPPPESQARNRALLEGTWAEGGYLSVLVTQHSDGQVEFDPRINGARAFLVQQDELINTLLKWGHG